MDPLLAQSVITGGGHAASPQSPRERNDSGDSMPQRERDVALKHRVLQIPEPHIPPRSEGVQAERRCREKRVVLSRSEERQIERLTDRMADELRTSLKLSHLMRATVSVLLHAEEEIMRRLQGSTPLERPSNWDPVALAQFEQELAKILSHALRDAPPLR